MLQRMRSKKGFTLAELLIVVAIIAILVAIAVPLFIGAIDDAEHKVYEANKHAVRSAAVAYILENTELDLSTVDDSTKYLKAVGTLKPDGSLVKVVVTIEDSEVTDDPFATWKSNKATAEKTSSETEYTLTVHVAKTTLSGS